MARKPDNIKANTLIYTLADPDTGEVRYIGKTVKSLATRLSAHIHSYKRERNHRVHWIKSIVLSGKKPAIAYLDNCPWDESQELERYWIQQFTCWGFNLVNSSLGGEGTLGTSMSDSVKRDLVKRVSKPVFQYSLEGNFIAEYFSVTQACEVLGIKSKSKVCMAARGDRNKSAGFLWSYAKVPTMSPYVRAKYESTERQMRARVESNSVPIYQYTWQRVLIRKWCSTKEACLGLNINQATIVRLLDVTTPSLTVRKANKYLWLRQKI